MGKRFANLTAGDTWAPEGQVHHTVYFIIARSQTLYFVFKVPRARVIKYRPRGFIDRQRNGVMVGEEENRRYLFLGSLSHEDGDVDENGKKAIGLDCQNNNFARASRFFVHFFAVTARLRRQTP